MLFYIICVKLLEIDVKLGLTFFTLKLLVIILKDINLDTFALEQHKIQHYA